MNLYLSLTGPDPRELFRRAAALPAFARRASSKLSIDYQDERADGRWVDRILDSGSDGFATFSSDDEMIKWSAAGGVNLGLTGLPKRPEAVLDVLAPLPFELAVAKPIHRDWARGGKWKATTFGQHHVAFGPFCLIKGDGHDRFVSTRWLEHGPWKLWRGPHDTTLVQFHDLEADADTALAQAAPGHKLLGIDDESGYLPIWGFRFQHDLAGLYEAELRRQKIVVMRRDVSPREMLEACMWRVEPRDEDNPIHRVAFVFLEEERARAHLHALWLRGLECWTIVRGSEVRLDEDYAPITVKPAWVAALDEAARR